MRSSIDDDAAGRTASSGAGQLLPSRTGPGNLLLFAEAALLIVLAAIGLRVMSFKMIGRLASRPLRKRCQGNQDALVDRVRWAVKAAAWRSPLRAMCFERGLTAQLMLRRRGVDSLLYYGAAPGRSKPLEAHVWVVANGVGVTGAEIASNFATLAIFPGSPQEPA